MALVKRNFHLSGGLIKGKNVILCLTLILMASQILQAFHLPRASFRGPNLMRRQDDIEGDGEDEEMDSGASSPRYQNQNDGQDAGSDGYDDGYNEPDGSYSESPRDEEGQADLERFFDDHLGASEKDGMDKENLPTNLIPIAIPFVNNVGLEQRRQMEAPKGLNYEPSAALNNNLDREKFQNPLIGQATDVETRFIKLPNNKLLITRQSISRGPIYKGGLDLPEVAPIPEEYFNQQEAKPVESQPPPEAEEENLNAKGSEIVATENDDFDRVYVTKLNNKPFKIDALGGFDPEEDFRDASRDLEETSSKRNQSKRKSRRNRKEQEEEEPQKDITFEDPEELFNDASETDEVTFGPNEEHDLEAEMQAQSYDQPGKATSFTTQKPSLSEEDKEPKVSIDRSDDEDREGAWAHDGVEDMEIPSQSHQDAVLAKAARQEELARRAAEAEEAEAEPETREDDPNQQEEETPEGQRMANADYMKDDLPAMDDDDGSGFDS